jgi:uncharacterized protein (TIRG00374 family)
VSIEKPDNDGLKPSRRWIQLAKQLAALLFGCLFLWLAFQGRDLRQIWIYAREVDPVFILLMCCSCIISHLLRAARWVILLGPLSERRISLWNSFCAVMIGYLVNIVIPRGGEVARLVSISKTEGLPWVGVLPTMFIDRLLDLALLCLIVGSTLPILPKSLLKQMPLLQSGGILMILGSIAMLALLPRMADFIERLLLLPRMASLMPKKLNAVVESLASQFRMGTLSLTDPKAFPKIAALSVGIWFFYWLNTYLAVLAFHLQNRVSLLQSYIVLAVGSMGVLIPTPGSVGGYHFFVSQALILTAGIDKDLALALATVTHIICFVVAICIPAFFCITIQSFKQSKAKRQEFNRADAKEHPEIPS